MDREDWLGAGCIAGGIALPFLLRPRIPTPDGWVPFPDIEIIPEDWGTFPYLESLINDRKLWESTMRWEMIKERFEIGDYADSFFNIRIGTKEITTFADSYEKYISRAGLSWGEWDFRYNTYCLLGARLFHWQPETKQDWVDKYTRDWTAPSMGNFILDFLMLGIISVPKAFVGQVNIATWDLFWESLCLHHKAVMAVKKALLEAISKFNTITGIAGGIWDIGEYKLVGGGP